MPANHGQSVWPVNGMSGNHGTRQNNLFLSNRVDIQANLEIVAPLQVQLKLLQALPFCRRM